MTNACRFFLFFALLTACGSSPGTDAAVLPDSYVAPDVGTDAAPDIDANDHDANDVDANLPDVGPVDVGPDAATSYCTDTADQTRIGMDPSIADLVGNCGSSNLGGEPATRNCIESTSGLTMQCADCFDLEVQCGRDNCALMCAGGNSPACLACLHTHHCDSMFTACSGIVPP